MQVAMKLAPDRKKFMEVIAGSGDINADMETFCATFAPLLEENHKFLVRFLLRYDMSFPNPTSVQSSVLEIGNMVTMAYAQLKKICILYLIY